MNLGRLSINQPILAMVLSIVLLIVGALAYTTLPVSEYPQVVPPTVVVTTQYPGATAQTVSDTVAAPIEQEINGVEDMLYLYSQATSNGNLTITVTFKLGTDLDKAQVLVQNRVAIAQPRLPDEVQRNGVVTRKNSPDILMVVFMLSPDDSFDQLYISNYALLQVRDELLRLRRGGGRDPRAKPADHRRPDRGAADRRPRVPAQSHLHRAPEGSEAIRGHRGQGGRRWPHGAAARCGASRTGCLVLFDQQFSAAEIGGRAAGDPAARLERAGDREKHFRHDGEAEGQFSKGPRLQHRLQPYRIHRAIRPRADQDDLRGDV